MKDIKCKHCGKKIGTYNEETGELIEMLDDYTTCDICGEELCCQCSNYNERTDVYYCQDEECKTESNNISNNLIFDDFLD